MMLPLSAGRISMLLSFLSTLNASDPFCSLPFSSCGPLSCCTLNSCGRSAIGMVVGVTSKFTPSMWNMAISTFMASKFCTIEEFLFLFGKKEQTQNFLKTTLEDINFDFRSFCSTYAFWACRYDMSTSLPFTKWPPILR